MDKIHLPHGFPTPSKVKKNQWLDIETCKTF